MIPSEFSQHSLTHLKESHRVLASSHLFVQLAIYILINYSEHNTAILHAHAKHKTNIPTLINHNSGRPIIGSRSSFHIKPYSTKHTPTDHRSAAEPRCVSDRFYQPPYKRHDILSAAIHIGYICVYPKCIPDWRSYLVFTNLSGWLSGARIWWIYGNYSDTVGETNISFFIRS